ncbi:MAG: outer membrane protein assembly factor BamC [Aquisalimonadaceae bacterium]
MTLNFSRQRILLISVLVLFIAGCASRDVEEPAGTDRLTVPPDLSQERLGEIPELASRRSATLSEFAAGGGRTTALLPEPPGMAIQRQGADRWLVIDASPEQVWTWLGEFLERNEVEVIRRSESLGVVETDWLPRPLGVSGGVFLPLPADTDAAVLEQYVFRLEPGTQDTRTELYVAHRQAVRVNGGDEGWRPRDSDRGREVEALRTFMVHLGMSDAMAARAAGSSQSAPALSSIETSEDGRISLLVNESYLQGWRRTGLALDRAGFTVEDRDRSDGRYIVRYDPGAESARKKRGFFSRLAFWRDHEPEVEPGNYVIRVRSESGRTRLAVEDEEGEAVSPDLSERLLVLINEQLR